MKYPKFLKENDYIYLVSPSFGCSKEPYKSRLKKSISNFKSLGFNIVEGKNIYNQNGLLSQDINSCINELYEAFSSNASLILSVGGGEMMISILDKLDFDLLKKDILYMGYSDNTNITFLLNTIKEIVCIYGGCAPEFGTIDFIDYQLDMINLLKGNKFKFNGYPYYEIDSLKNEDNPYLNLNLTMKSNIITYPNDNIEFEGILIGGCIDCISLLVGTKFDNMKEFNKKYKDIIWYFEACEMNVIEVARRLTQLKYAGWFVNAKGFIFGRPILNEPMFENKMEDLIINTLKEFNVPILMNADIGHVKPQIPILSGAYAKIKAYSSSYEIEYIIEKTNNN